MEHLDEPADLPASPCIRMCCLDNDTDICTGCFRSLDEIRHWRASNAGERAQILTNCQARRAAHEARYGHPLRGF
jgi:uncharacterized protein